MLKKLLKYWKKLTTNAPHIMQNWELLKFDLLCKSIATRNSRVL